MLALPLSSVAAQTCRWQSNGVHLAGESAVIIELQRGCRHYCTNLWCGLKEHVGVSTQGPPLVPILVNNSVTSRDAVVFWWPCLVLFPLTSAHSLFMHCIDSPMNACYHPVQNLGTSTLLSKYTKIKIYRVIEKDGRDLKPL